MGSFTSPTEEELVLDLRDALMDIEEPSKHHRHNHSDNSLGILGKGDKSGTRTSTNNSNTSSDSNAGVGVEITLTPSSSSGALNSLSLTPERLSEAAVARRQSLKDSKEMNPSYTSSERKARTKLFRKVNKFMESWHVQSFLGALLALSLFLTDSWILGSAPESSNVILYSILMAVFLFFSFESIILSVVQAGYFLGFFFWMDIIGTFSILLDIGWLYNDGTTIGDFARVGAILRATRAAKLGARYGRYVLLMKKYLRMVPCLKGIFDDDDEEGDTTLSQVRKVSSELSTILSKRVAALVMIFVIIVPFLAYPTNDNAGYAWVDTFNYVASSVPTDTRSAIANVSTIAYAFFEEKDYSLLEVVVESPFMLTAYSKKYTDYSSQMASTIGTYKNSFTTGGVTYTTVLVVDESYPSKVDAYTNIILVIVVVIALFAFSMSFQSAVNELVVFPLERMMNKLRASATTMLKNMKVYELEKKESKRGQGLDVDDDEGEDLNEVELETEMLDKLVDKLSRIVKNVMPGQAHLEINAADMDSATHSWITSNYSTGSQSKNLTLNNSSSRGKSVRRFSTIFRQHNIDAKYMKMDIFKSWDFNVLKHNNEELVELMVMLFASKNLLNDFSVEDAKFRNFLFQLSEKYINTNMYHNFKHGCDVCFTSYKLIITPRLHDVISRLEFFSLLVAALAHDVGHPGVNNNYIINSKHPLALKHNDISPLENMHCVTLYDILAKNECNIFVHLGPKDWREVRKVIITSILGTDMTNHFEQINKLQLFLEVNGDETREFCMSTKTSLPCMTDDKNRMLIIELVLHSSDVSNPFKPFSICVDWANLVVEEFASQGDREKAEGLEVSPMMDRSQIVLCNMQMSFIEFVVTPLISTFVKVFPPLYEISENITTNFASWGDRRVEEIKVDGSLDVATKAAEIAKIETRIQKFKEKQSYTEGLRELITGASQ